ncbi:MAG: peptidylprolyl isomerase [Nanoarchaeota archaeon]
MDDSTKIKFETSEGNFVIQLYDDMPITTENFEKLVSQGFYDGVLFHRIIDGFMLQTGDPLTKDKSKSYLWGTGGPGYSIKDEFTHEGGNKNNRGTISMANSGPNTGGSQFFINTVNNNFLDTKHPAFGEVIQGMDVIDAISKVETDSNDRPVNEVKIIKASLI